MAPNLLLYQLLLVALVLICLMVHVWWLDHLSLSRFLSGMMCL